jgi:hypothetical protein
MAKIYDHYEHICYSSFLSTPKDDGDNYKYIIGFFLKRCDNRRNKMRTLE